MPRYDEVYAGLARLMGRAGGAKVQGIVIKSQRGGPAARDWVAAAMSAAIMSGDVDGVVAALGLLGVRPAVRDSRHS